MDYKELITMFEAALSCNKKTIQVLETTVSNNIATPLINYMRDLAIELEYSLEHEIEAASELKEEYTNPDSSIKRDINGLVISVGDRVLYHTPDCDNGWLEYRVSSIAPNVVLIDEEGEPAEFEFSTYDLEVI